MRYRGGLYKQFDFLFTGKLDDAKLARATGDKWERFGKAYGWLDMIMSLANDDLTKVDAITKQNHVLCLNILSMRKSKNQVEYEINKELYNQQ